MGIIVLYNRVYECISTMYTTYTNNFDTSHVAYLEHMTAEEQSAEWAIFAALQPPQADPSNTRTHCQTSSTTALHTYLLHHIPFYIFPTPTSPSTSAPPSQSHPILPSEKILSPDPTIPQQHQGEENTHSFVQQMLQPLVHNTDAAPAPGILFPNATTKVP